MANGICATFSICPVAFAPKQKKAADPMRLTLWPVKRQIHLKWQPAKSSKASTQLSSLASLSGGYSAG